mmetsp:Transcript_57622/g.137254  ORF Transcript_57622/g.137254 Transcript_57622/m.137254 type:complete len:263 (+) Transcript_57622:876-1664(+)
MNGHPGHNASRELDEIDIVGLGNERHGSGCPKVALDNLHFILFADELNVEGPRDLQGSAEFLRDALHLAMGLYEEALGGQEQSGIPTVDPGVLNMLCNGIVHKVSGLANPIHLDLLRPSDVLRDHNRVVSAYHGSCLQEQVQVSVVGDHTHSSTGEDIRRAHQNRVACRLAELTGFLQCCKLGPLWLINAQGVAKLAELVAILASIDGLNRCAKNADSTFVQSQSQVVRGLTTDRNHHASGVFQLSDVHNTLVTKLFEVESI